MNQQQYNYYVPQLYNPKKPGTSKGDVLGWISIACLIVTRFGGGFMFFGAGVIFGDSSLSTLISMLSSGLLALVGIAGIVTMIVGRVLDKDSMVAKVSMWLYIVFIVLEIIATLVMVIACVACGTACITQLDGCAGMG